MEDAVAVREVAVAKRPPRVLYHGDLTEQRGLLTMIDAIAQVNSVQAPELRLAGSLAPALRARLNGMPGMQRTRHLGWLDQAQLAEEMAQARAGLVLLHPTNNYLVIRPNKLFERSEEHTSELQSLMRNTYAVFCLK